MVVASPSLPETNKSLRHIDIPSIDLSGDRAHASRTIVEACEEFGFFKVTSHGVPESVSSRMEAIGFDFFSLPECEKQKAGPANPLGYGKRKIGFKGDDGELEYLLLHANPASVCNKAGNVYKKDPEKFRCAVNLYVEEMRELVSTILEMVSEELNLGDTKFMSKMIKDVESDSLLRFNHYPPDPNSNSSATTDDTVATVTKSTAVKDKEPVSSKEPKQLLRVGFGEHSDPQILTLLRSNNVGGLQILYSPRDGGESYWVPVPPDTTAFYVHVGDMLQALTNGRFKSVRHRAIANSSSSSRMSMIYFSGPPLQAQITALPELIHPPLRPCLYRSFTWGEYKKVMYSLSLGYNRLDLFLLEDEERSHEDSQTRTLCL